MSERLASESASLPVRSSCFITKGWSGRHSRKWHTPPTCRSATSITTSKPRTTLVEAAIAEHAYNIEMTLDSLNRHRTPKGRLHTLVRMMAEQRDIAAQFGCPHGTLTVELDKRNGGIDRTVARLMKLALDWAAAQFAAMGRSDAGDLAFALIASYEGMSLLTDAIPRP